MCVVQVAFVLFMSRDVSVGLSVCVSVGDTCLVCSVLSVQVVKGFVVEYRLYSCAFMFLHLFILVLPCLCVWHMSSNVCVCGGGWMGVCMCVCVSL